MIADTLVKTPFHGEKQCGKLLTDLFLCFPNTVLVFVFAVEIDSVSLRICLQAVLQITYFKQFGRILKSFKAFKFMEYNM